MSDQELDQLDELKASGGDESEVMDPTPVNAKKRKADKATAKEAADAEDNDEDDEDEEDDEAKVIKASAKKKAGKSMGEAVDEIFSGEDLSEDFKERAAVLFETVVLEKVNVEVERLEEEFSSKLDEQAELATEDLTKKVDAYLDYVAEQWMEENTLAVESGIRSDIAESFISGLKELFSEHRIDVPDEQVDLVAEMAEKIEALEASLNEQIDTNIEVSKELDEAKKSDVFDTLSEGLAYTQAEKLRSLTEGLEYVDLDDYSRKVEIIKENYFGKSAIVEETDELDPVNEESDTKYVDPQMALYAKSISKTFRNIK
tara:strand:+ start:2025 stop:2972 length:948 start_codon:yes stop_codon:yes gene_type:complete